MRAEASKRGLPAAALLVLGALGMVACSGARPPVDGPASDLFRWSVERFQEGSYGDAVNGFQLFLNQNPVHPRADSAQFLVAESMLQSDRALEAAQEFSQMALTRPGSPLADDAQLGACRAYWESSPGIERGQEHTRSALEECRRLEEFFPESDLLSRAEEIITRAREKLARKQYRIARYYYDDGYYESANIYLETVLNDYPDTSIVPRVLATYHRSLRELGFEAEARQVRERLLTEFPDSEAARSLGGAEGEDGGSSADSRRL